MATDGGRHDVCISERLRRAVFWDDAEPCPVRRCSWFKKGPLDAQPTPYDEDVAEKLEVRALHIFFTACNCGCASISERMSECFLDKLFCNILCAIKKLLIGKSFSKTKEKFFVLIIKKFLHSYSLSRRNTGMQYYLAAGISRLISRMVTG